MNQNPNQKLHINKKYKHINIFFFPVGHQFIDHVSQGKIEREIPFFSGV